MIKGSHPGLYLEETIIWKDTCTSVFTASLFTIARTWEQPKCLSTDEWIKKMFYTHTKTHSGILLSHKNEGNNAICSNMDGPRDYHTKWNKQDRERQISYNITYMWNLKKRQKWIYSQNRNRLTDIENKLMVTKGKKDRRDKLEGWVSI